LRSLGITVIEAPPIDVGGERVSSTRVRSALVAGDVSAAAELLGRVHDVDGVVVKGDGRGRTIGVPTANLELAGGMVPRDGVYAVVARIEGEETRLRGVANLGSRPTFAAGRSIEVHFFDLDRDLYGLRMRVGFQARLRDEQKFDGVTSLVAQIRADLAQGRELLSGADEARWSWL
jgi:riboflavin kinase / FMN adenylyltransferase